MSFGKVERLLILFKIPTARKITLIRNFFRRPSANQEPLRVFTVTVPDGVVMQWFNLTLALQLQHSGGVGSIPGGTLPLERHNKVSQTRLALDCL